MHTDYTNWEYSIETQEVTMWNIMNRIQFHMKLTMWLTLETGNRKFFPVLGGNPTQLITPKQIPSQRLPFPPDLYLKLGQHPCF